MTRDERFPCATGDHRFHWFRSTALECQQQAESSRAGQPFGDDPRVPYALDPRATKSFRAHPQTHDAWQCWLCGTFPTRAEWVAHMRKEHGIKSPADPRVQKPPRGGSKPL